MRNAKARNDVNQKEQVIPSQLIRNNLKGLEPTEMLLRQKDPKGFTVQTSRSEFKTSIKNEDGQLRAKENIWME